MIWGGFDIDDLGLVRLSLPKDCSTKRKRFALSFHEERSFLLYVTFRARDPSQERGYVKMSAVARVIPEVHSSIILARLVPVAKGLAQLGVFEGRFLREELGKRIGGTENVIEQRERRR
jgi:hypothetical protein